MNPWLTILGIGDRGIFTSIDRTLLTQSTLIVGGDRHLQLLRETYPNLTVPTRPWTSPIQDAITQLLTHRHRPVCILASGDPLCYGIASTLLKQIPLEEMHIIPHLSAFTLASARLGWSYPDVETLSLCGRDINLLRAVLYPNAKILVLSADRTTPHAVAKLLTQWGYGETLIQILEHLDGPTERQFSQQADQWTNPDCAQLNTIALHCPPHPNRSITSRTPGLPDSAYQHDGQLTKREVRSLTLAALAPYPGALLWDVGAGCGSISIEWMRTHPRCRAIAIESHPARLLSIAHNARALGVPNLQIINGRAPESLQNFPQPDVIFIGGGLTRSGVFETCWDALAIGGRLVANGVTLESESKLFELQQRYGGHLTRTLIQRAEPIGSFLGWKSLPPITQWVVEKAVHTTSLQPSPEQACTPD